MAKLQAASYFSFPVVGSKGDQRNLASFSLLTRVVCRWAQGTGMPIFFQECLEKDSKPGPREIRFQQSESLPSQVFGQGDLSHVETDLDVGK